MTTDAVAGALVEPSWLADRLDDPSVAVVDMRWRTDGSAPSDYRRGHIPGALFLDWTRDIVDPAGRFAFLLAPPGPFAMAMERLGIGDDTTVVAYSDMQGSGPFRLWWAFRMYGHDGAVRILDGGFSRWVGEARPVTAEVPEPRRATWTPRPSPEPAASAADVSRAITSGAVVLDSRPADQFRGDAVWFETGPVPAGPDGVAHTARGDLRAGHVPGARSVPAGTLYREDGTMSSPGELRTLFAAAGVDLALPAITYCGVGLSAAALMFALERAGASDVRLYDASWEEWGRDPALPVERASEASGPSRAR